MRRQLLFTLMLLAVLTPLRAQLYVGAHGGITLPQGNYAESHMSDNEWMFSEGHQYFAGVGKGWTGGIDISFAMPFHTPLELAFSADYMRSPMGRDVREYYQYIYSLRYSQCAQYEMELPHITNIPILAGVRYAYPLSRGVDLYAEAMAGVNLRRISSWTLAFADPSWTHSDGQEFDQYNNLDIRTYVPSNTFALRLGAGIMMLKKITLGASLNLLGEAPLAWDRTTTTRYDVYGQTVENTSTLHTQYHTLSPTLVMVQVGYRLNPFHQRVVQDW